MAYKSVVIGRLTEEKENGRISLSFRPVTHIYFITVFNGGHNFAILRWVNCNVVPFTMYPVNNGFKIRPRKSPFSKTNCDVAF